MTDLHRTGDRWRAEIAIGSVHVPISGLPDADAEYVGLNVIFRVKPCDPEDLIALVKATLNCRATA